ncbi:MAG: bL17 family ribosomal protein [Candidatus Cloacimonetes bacterium]|nr:bL17 family ribosomal protein [Candidatus Cloacimonadota bacterium]
MGGYTRVIKAGFSRGDNAPGNYPVSGIFHHQIRRSE